MVRPGQHPVVGTDNTLLSAQTTLALGFDGDEWRRFAFTAHQN